MKLFKSVSAVAGLPYGKVAIGGMSAIDDSYTAVIMTKDAVERMGWNFQSTASAKLSDRSKFTKRTALGGTSNMSMIHSLFDGVSDMGLLSNNVDLDKAKHILLIGTDEDLIQEINVGNDLIMTACGSAPDLFLNKIGCDRSKTEKVVRFAAWRMLAEKLLINTSSFDVVGKQPVRTTAEMQAAGSDGGAHF